LQLAAAQGFQALVEGLLFGLVSLDDAIDFGLVHNSVSTRDRRFTLAKSLEVRVYGARRGASIKLWSVRNIRAPAPPGSGRALVAHPAADLLLVPMMTLPLADLVLVAMVRVTVPRRGGRRGRPGSGGYGQDGGSEQFGESHMRLVLPDVTTESGRTHRPIAMLS
jgi:hypothetical protein